MNLTQLRKFLGIAILASGLLLISQMMHVYTIYEHQKTMYHSQIESKIKSLIFDFNMQRTDKNYLFGYDPKTRISTYVFEKQNVHTIHVDSTQDIREFYEQGCYDIRDTMEWKLNDLHKYLLHDLNLSDIPFTSLQLTLLDSTYNIKDTYPVRHVSKRALASPECDIQLGYLTQDHLYAYCPYPFALFWKEAGDRILLAICLFTIIALCVAIFYRTIKHEKLEAHYRDLYVHSIVHDLKRPISNQILLQESIIPQIPAPYKSIAEQGMEQMQNTLQAINRILLQATDAHGLKLNKKHFNLQTLLQELVHPKLWRVAPNKQFQITVDYSAASPYFFGDPHFLHAVFCNFIDNSLKYSGPQVDIAIACVNSDNHHIRLTFTDNGQGISSTALKHIFDRYNRGDHQNDKSVKGHGQGLHYARLVIKAHHGTIAIDSPPGSGTSVIVTLPISKD